MSLARKSAIMALIVVMVISTTPSAAVAIDEPSNWSDDKVFDGATGDRYTNLVGDNQDLNKAYINTTGNTILFRADIDNSKDGLEDDALQVYIDTDSDSQTGINSDTVSDGGKWGDFYDGLGSIGADYRVTASDGGAPIVESHSSGGAFETIRSVDIIENNNKVVVEVEKSLIQNPETFDVKFAYISDPDTSDISGSEYVWAPESAVRVGGSGDATKTATIKPTVKFGAGLEDEASVEFTLTDDEETETVRRVNHSSSDDLTQAFTVNPSNFNGDGGEVAVEVLNDDDYLFDREVDNTEAVSVSADETKTPQIELSTLNATVEFGSEAVSDDGSVEFTLTDDNLNDDDVRPVDHDSNNNLKQTFTVNPNNFDSKGSLTVEVVDDEDYPYKETKDVDDMSVGSSQSVTNGPFDADTIGHDFILINEDGTRDIATDSEFTQQVNFHNINPDGSDVYVITHVIDFDPARIDGENISVDYGAGPVNFNTNDSYLTTGVGTEVEEDGKYEIQITAAGDYSKSTDAIQTPGNNETLYDITFPLEDIQGEIQQGPENSIDVAPVTSDETELNDRNGNTLSYTTSAQSVPVKNSDTSIESTEVTHRTEYGNMVGSVMNITVDVTTNDGELAEIRLENGNDVVLEDSGSDVDISCSGSDCEGALQYTPVAANATYQTGGYLKNEKFYIVVEDDEGDTYTIPGDTKNEYTLRAEIYKQNDVNKDGTSADLYDVRKVIQNRGAGDGELPWGEDEGELARSDLNNDGEIDITEVTTIADTYSP